MVDHVEKFIATNVCEPAVAGESARAAHQQRELPFAVAPLGSAKSNGLLASVSRDLTDHGRSDRPVAGRWSQPPAASAVRGDVVDDGVLNLLLSGTCPCMRDDTNAPVRDASCLSARLRTDATGTSQPCPAPSRDKPRQRFPPP